MNLAGRLGIVLLAIVPLVWGLCPCAVTGFHCCAAATACPVETGPRDAEASSCPCCKKKAPQDRTPEHPPRRQPCDGCPLMEASHGVTPAQIVPTLPPPPAQPMGFVEQPAAGMQEIGRVEVLEGMPALGPPPDLLSSVVLLI